MKYCLIATLSLFMFCTDLENGPYSSATANVLFTDQESMLPFLAKLYGGLSLTGQQGPNGNSDIQGVDEGFFSFFRSVWNLQELTSDEALIRWGDNVGILELCYNTWGSSNQFMLGPYSRLSYQIALCNEFLSVLETYGVGWDNNALYKAEAQFLRALAYYYLMDLFGKVPLVTEPTSPTETSAQSSRAEIFNFIEKELLSAEQNLLDHTATEYGRASKQAAQAMLAKLYLNAEVYTNTAMYDKCLEYCAKVIGSGHFSLVPIYKDAFAADNQDSKETIFPIPFDAERTQNWGGIIYLGLGALNGDWGGGPQFGTIDGGWSGATITEELADRFTENDQRALFFTEEDVFNGVSQSRATPTPISLSSGNNEGYRVKKFLNLNKDGSSAAVAGSNFPSNDFPVLRLADVYLMYAEANLRGGGGDLATALQYINLIQTRAGLPDRSSINLEFLLEERSRELYWENHRRTDLIRFGKYISGRWGWKGNVYGGVPVNEIRRLFPVPASQLVANPKLVQNPGY